LKTPAVPIFFLLGASVRAGPPALCVRTGLYACIFFASGKKGYRFNPLRVPKSGFPAGFWHRSLPAANSIYPPLADSNGNSGIHAADTWRLKDSPQS
jgi:hypothetical protein